MKDVLRIATAVPKIRIGDPLYNSEQIANMIVSAKEKGASIIVLPELALSGYTCGDLFFQSSLLSATEKEISKLAEYTKGVVAAIGAPVSARGRLYNCAVIYCDGKICAVVPKTYIPNYNEFNERRYFQAPDDELHFVNICGKEYPFGNNLIFSANGFTLGVDICEDVWAPIPPSSIKSLAGADIILNLSASNETVSKRTFRVDSVRMHAARTMSCYVYCSAGYTESTSEFIFSGHAFITDGSAVISQNENIIDSDHIICADVDMETIRLSRMKIKTFSDAMNEFSALTSKIKDIPLAFTPKESDGKLIKVRKYPFVPETEEKRFSRSMTAFELQSKALARRLSVTGGKLVVGISGGLDSTLALLVAVKSIEILGLPRTNITAVTMPCFGTSGETYNNALALMNSLGVDTRCVNIGESVKMHLKDIGLSQSDRSTAFENAQARERTQVLMDIANSLGALVLGTGDLSEIALGWCTYNGDHMSMYNVNCDIPKTLIAPMLLSLSKTEMFEKIADVLHKVTETPISPELLPPDEKGKIAQKTEDIVGPYALHDFFLYYVVKFGFSPKKIYSLALIAFENEYSPEVIKKWLVTFYKRFFTQQFKRDAAPDGVRIGSVSLSAKSDWRMPSDASYTLWVKEAESL